MKKIIIEKELFEYSELSEGAKKRAIEDWLNDEGRCLCCDDLIYDEFDSKCIKLLFGTKCIDLKLQYDFSGCQGSGINIYGYVTFTDVVNAAKNTMNYLSSMQLHRLEFYSEFLQGIELSENNRYTYSLKASDKKEFNDCLFNYLDDIYGTEKPLVSDMICELMKADKRLIKDAVDNMFEQLEKIEHDLYSYGCQIFNNMTDEDMEEREAYYTSDGKFYDYMGNIN